MTKETFNKLVDDLINTASTTLKTKNAKYAPADDALHNFHYGAQLDNSTTAQTIWHYMKKHMVALLDKINRDDWEDLDDVKEKIQDIINYLIFMWCAANEDNLNYCYDICYDETHDCGNCKYADIWDEDSFKEIDGKLIATLEPCNSCRNNFIPNTEDYKNHKNNWKEG